MPTPLFAALAADELPDADVTTFGDSAGAYPDVPAVNASIGAGMWGTDTVGPDWPGYEELTPEQRSIPGLYVQSMLHNPDITLPASTSPSTRCSRSSGASPDSSLTNS